MAYTQDISLALGSGKAGIADLRAQLVDTAGSNIGSAISTGFVEIGAGNYLWHYASWPDGHRGGVKFYSAAASGVVLAFASINPEKGENTDLKTSTRSSHNAAAGATAVRTELATELGRIDENVSAAKTLTSGERTSIGTAVWASVTRTLSAFGFTVATSANSTETAIKATTDKLDAMIEVDGADYRFDTNALEQAPTGSGGGGGASAADVWAYATRTLSDKTGFELTSGERTNIATAVWANATRTLSSYGTLVADAASAAATAVWAAGSRTLSAFAFTVAATVADKTGYSLAVTPPTAVQIRQEIDSNSTALASITSSIAEILGLSGKFVKLTNTVYDGANLESYDLELYPTSADMLAGTNRAHLYQVANSYDVDGLITASTTTRVS